MPTIDQILLLVGAGVLLNLGIIAAIVLPRRIGNLEIGEEVPPRYLLAAVVALSAALGLVLALALDDWQSLVLVRDGVLFQESDPYYQFDLGFFVYWLPFESALAVERDRQRRDREDRGHREERARPADAIEHDEQDPTADDHPDVIKTKADIAEIEKTLKQVSAAASTATTLIEKYGVEFIAFTGVAGALDPGLNVGDIVVGIVGAFLGGWIFSEAHWASPIAGLGGVTVVDVLVVFFDAGVLPYAVPPKRPVS